MNLENFDELLKQEMLSVKGGTSYGTMDTCQCTSGAGQTSEDDDDEEDKCICSIGALQKLKPIDPPLKCICSDGGSLQTTT